MVNDQGEEERDDTLKKFESTGIFKVKHIVDPR